MEKRGWRREGREEEVEEKRWRRGGRGEEGVEKRRMKKVGPSQTMLNAQIFIQLLQFNQKISHHIIMND